jgi:hypothetical protein
MSGRDDGYFSDLGGLPGLWILISPNNA